MNNINIIILFLSINIIYVHDLSYTVIPIPPKEKLCKVINCSCVHSKTSINSIPLCLNNQIKECFMKYGRCGFNKKTNNCNFEYTKKFTYCLNNNNYCVKNGYFGEKCEKNTINMKKYSPLKIIPMYAICFKKANCILKNNGKCGIENMKELKICLWDNKHISRK
jgi:hypothetical protein